jgi:DNA-binding Lrp family transcriptional regulator
MRLDVCLTGSFDKSPAKMRLSEKDRRIIAWIEFRPFATADEIARALRMKSHQVAYALRRLLDAKVIKLAPIIDLWRLGYQDIGIFFSLLPSTGEKRQKAVKALLQLPGLAWLGSFLGQYEFGAVVFCKHPGELRSFLTDFEKRFGTLISTWTVAPRVSFTAFNRGYLNGTPAQVAFTFSYSAADQLTVRNQEMETLKALANRDISSFRDLAREIGVPNSTFEERKSSLQARGIVKGFHYVVDSNALKAHAIKLLLTIHGKSGLLHDSLLAFAGKFGGITEIVEVFGRWDFEVTVELFEMRNLPDLIGGLHLATKGQISNIEILTHVEDLHFSLCPIGLSQEFQVRR